jgi:hypothetical protein
MEAVFSAETPVNFRRITRHRIPEDIRVVFFEVNLIYA